MLSSIRPALIALLATTLPFPWADAGDSALRWTTQMPAELMTEAAPAHRTLVEAKTFFHAPLMRARQVAEVLAYFGAADGFTRQSIWDPGAPEGATGGTLRFRLEDGSEFHASTPDLLLVHFAVLHTSDGRMEFLYK